MEKPSFSFLKNTSMAGMIAILGLLLLPGCADSGVTVRFANLTSGTVLLNYTVGWEVLGAESGPSRLRLPLPQSRESWTQLAGTVENLVLESVNLADTPEGVNFRVQVRFPTLRSLEGLAIALGHRLTVLENSGVYTWSFTPTVPPVSGWPEDLRSFGLTRYGNRTLRWELILPRDLRSFSEGTPAADRRSLVLDKTLGSYFSGPLAEWRVQW